ncbi:RNA polymerase II general transcription factor BTF3 [Handroanthus impetiginosus]|uniref:RNA polymerase II general transcription factor BTF3 n=1 Tax=Handroanthus impetiginosus TaxID=429701 RepID=A0A2G9GXH1_9LAMI|nr:RNA polymerase II general transcription factor BTF3 [Handroanthus impetiginosus]
MPQEVSLSDFMKMAGSVRTRGKGTMRRKKKAVRKTTTTDHKRLQSTLKRIGANAIPAIEEDLVIQFTDPKVQASIAANTWVVGELQDILPQIINQQGLDNLENLKKLAEQFQKQRPAASSGTAPGATGTPDDDDDDEVPELVAGETFEAAAEEGHAQAS